MVAVIDSVDSWSKGRFQSVQFMLSCVSSWGESRVDFFGFWSGLVLFGFDLKEVKSFRFELDRMFSDCEISRFFEQIRKIFKIFQLSRKFLIVIFFFTYIQKARLGAWYAQYYTHIAHRVHTLTGYYTSLTRRVPLFKWCGESLCIWLKTAANTSIGDKLKI